MDYNLQQIIKKEKQNYEEDFETEIGQSLYVNVKIEKQEETYDNEWSYDALTTSFEEMCTICGQIFNNRFILLQHNISHLSIPLEKLHGITPSYVIKKSKRKNVMHKCEFCNKMLPYKAWITHRKEVHSIGRVFKCAQCGKNFQCKRYLRNHIIHVHINVRSNSSNTCPICLKESKNSASLRCHIRDTHSNGGYQCDICGSKLKCRSYLLTHRRRVHYNDGKEHECDKCHKTYRSPTYLRIHKKNSHRSNKPAKKVKIKKIKVIDIEEE